MADLDDFFAKKDRRKSRGKKFTTAYEIAKKLEETGKRSEKLKKDKLQGLQGGGQEVDEQGNAIQDEDEWKDFEEEKKDYTGLKIQNLTLGQDDGDGTNSGGEGDEDGGLEENESGEMVPKRKQGPWRVVSLEEGGDQEAVVGSSGGCEEAGNGGGGNEVLQGGGTASDKGKKDGIYVIPALARRQQQSASSTLTPHNRSLQMSRLRNKMKTAPDVRNEELFPSLSAANTQETSKKKREETTVAGFEEVRNSKSHTARVDQNQMRETSQLALGNKFTALDHDES